MACRKNKLSKSTECCPWYKLGFFSTVKEHWTARVLQTWRQSNNDTHLKKDATKFKNLLLFTQVVTNFWRWLYMSNVTNRYKDVSKKKKGPCVCWWHMAIDCGAQFMVASLDREFYNALKFLITLYMQHREVANFFFFLDIILSI